MARQRAEAIKNYFVKQGITEDRIVVDSNGSTISSLEIQSDDDNEVRDAKNRRVMFEVVE
jgi:outer membrane protein OmpA-like peptidoglycan-associated protein